VRIAVDIDGTVSDVNWRISRIPNWDYFYEGIPNDSPIAQGVALVQALRLAGNSIAWTTGRPERTRDMTSRWLQKHDLLVELDPLYMRSDNDHRPNVIQKVEMYLKLLPDLILEDNEDIADALVTKGLFVVQFKNGVTHDIFSGEIH
jgi:S-adenosylhomocysteine hydrolase